METCPYCGNTQKNYFASCKESAAAGANIEYKFAKKGKVVCYGNTETSTGNRVFAEKDEGGNLHQIVENRPPQGKEKVEGLISPMCLFLEKETSELWEGKAVSHQEDCDLILCSNCGEKTCQVVRVPSEPGFYRELANQEKVELQLSPGNIVNTIKHAIQKKEEKNTLR